MGRFHITHGNDNIKQGWWVKIYPFDIHVYVR